MAEAAAPKPKFDEPKEEKPKGQTVGEYTGEVILFIIAVLFIASLLGRFLGYFSGGGTVGANGVVSAPSFSWDMFLNAIISSPVGGFIKGFLLAYITISNLLCLFFLAVLVYSLIKMREVERIWNLMINPEPIVVLPNERKNDRWQRVLSHVASNNPSDWRLAVLEADIILDELLNQLGYVGDTVGDKLKKVNRGDFITLDQAWEAHRIRNAIAHEGQDFVLTDREARRIVGLYEAVFRSFDFI